MSAPLLALAVASCASATAVGFLWCAPGRFAARVPWTWALRASTWVFIACCWLLVIYSPVQPLAMKWVVLVLVPGALGAAAFAIVAAASMRRRGSYDEAT